MRFELTKGFPPYALSRGAPSTTRPPLRSASHQRGAFLAGFGSGASLKQAGRENARKRAVNASFGRVRFERVTGASGSCLSGRRAKREFQPDGSSAARTARCSLRNAPSCGSERGVSPGDRIASHRPPTEQPPPVADRPAQQAFTVTGVIAAKNGSGLRRFSRASGGLLRSGNCRVSPRVVNDCAGVLPSDRAERAR